MTVASPAYRLVPGWESLPAGFVHRDVADVAVDADDNVLLLTRFDSRVIVYDADGTFLRSWGEDRFSARPHGIAVAPDGSVWIAEEGLHALLQFTPDGRLLRTIGTPGSPSDTGADPDAEGLAGKLASIRIGGPPFNRPTHVAVAPDGSLYATDGYGNARVHQFAADGTHIRSWGRPGTGPGEFNLPHDVVVAPDGRVIVADRENDRIQVFDADGRYIEQWTDFHRPAGLAFQADGTLVVAELAWRPGWSSFVHGSLTEECPSRVAIVDPAGSVITRFGGAPGHLDGNLQEAHGIAVDSTGAIYVAEVTYSGSVQWGLCPDDCHTFQKFERVAEAGG